MPTVLTLVDGRDWNEEFQRLMGDFQQDADKELERMAKLKTLSSEFTSRATSIGTKIVQELFLPPDKKTIMPVTNETGGIAGGSLSAQQRGKLCFFHFCDSNEHREL
jgi:hypothetical protein